MSKYLTFSQICFRNRELLVAALADVGYGQVEVGEGLTLVGYRGDARPERAEVVVRREFVGAASNDLGFARSEAGYVPLISEYDVRYLAQRHGGDFLAKLRTAYHERVVQEVARRVRGSLQREQEGHTIKLRVRY